MTAAQQAAGRWRAGLVAGLLLAACQPPGLSVIDAPPVSAAGAMVATTVRLGGFGTTARQALKADIQRIDVKLRQRTAVGPPVVWTPVGATLSVDRSTQPGSVFGAALTVRFPLVPDGTYSLSAEAFDAGSVSLNQAGPAISNTFAVAVAGSPQVTPAPALSLALKNGTGETITGNTISFSNGTPWNGPAAGGGYDIARRYGVFQTVGDLGNLAGRMVQQNTKVYVASTDHHVIEVVDLPNGAHTAMVGRADDGGHTVDTDPSRCQLDQPKGIGMAGNGDLYFTTAKGTAIFRLLAAGTMDQVAGRNPYSNQNTGDGAAAADADVYVDDLAVTTAGTVYVCSQQDRIVRRFAAGGTISTVAGGGGDDPGNGGPADQAVLTDPVLVAADGNSWLYILERGGRLRRLNLAQATPTIDEVGEWADLDRAEAMTVGPDRQVYLACADKVVRAVNPLLRKIATVAGDGNDGLPADGDPAGKPTGLVSGLAFDKHGALLLLPQAQPTLLRLNW